MHSKGANQNAHRFEANPLLKPSDIRPSAPNLEVACLLNPAVFRFENRTWLLLRVAERPPQTEGKVTVPILEPHGGIRIMEFDRSDPDLDLSDPRLIHHCGTTYLTTLSHLRLAVSNDGIRFQESDLRGPIPGRGPLESYGIEDCRVARIGDEYYLMYTQVSAMGAGVGLKSTRNWRQIDSHGVIFAPPNKDCALFEERIDGRYYALHRPSSPGLGGNHIWLAESPDLRHWGNHRCLIQTRPHSWDSERVGAGAPPIKTSAGWLEIYHGATAENRYCLGAFLLDLDEPWNVIARSELPLTPRTNPVNGRPPLVLSPFCTWSSTI